MNTIDEWYNHAISLGYGTTELANEVKEAKAKDYTCNNCNEIDCYYAYHEYKINGDCLNHAEPLPSIPKLLLNQRSITKIRKIK